MNSDFLSDLCAYHSAQYQTQHILREATSNPTINPLTNQPFLNDSVHNSLPRTTVTFQHPTTQEHEPDDLIDIHFTNPSDPASNLIPTRTNHPTDDNSQITVFHYTSSTPVQVVQMHNQYAVFDHTTTNNLPARIYTDKYHSEAVKVDQLRTNHTMMPFLYIPHICESACFGTNPNNPDEKEDFLSIYQFKLQIQSLLRYKRAQKQYYTEVLSSSTMNEYQSLSLHEITDQLQQWEQFDDEETTTTTTTTSSLNESIKQCNKAQSQLSSSKHKLSRLKRELKPPQVCPHLIPMDLHFQQSQLCLCRQLHCPLCFGWSVSFSSLKNTNKLLYELQKKHKFSLSQYKQRLMPRSRISGSDCRICHNTLFPHLRYPLYSIYSMNLIKYYYLDKLSTSFSFLQQFITNELATRLFTNTYTKNPLSIAQHSIQHCNTILNDPTMQKSYSQLPSLRFSQFLSKLPKQDEPPETHEHLPSSQKTATGLSIRDYHANIDTIHDSCLESGLIIQRLQRFQHLYTLPLSSQGFTKPNVQQLANHQDCQLSTPSHPQSQLNPHSSKSLFLTKSAEITPVVPNTFVPPPLFSLQTHPNLTQRIEFPKSYQDLLHIRTTLPSMNTISNTLSINTQQFRPLHDFLTPINSTELLKEVTLPFYLLQHQTDPPPANAKSDPPSTTSHPQAPTPVTSPAPPAPPSRITIDFTTPGLPSTTIPNPHTGKAVIQQLNPLFTRRIKSIEQDHREKLFYSNLSKESLFDGVKASTKSMDDNVHDHQSSTSNKPGIVNDTKNIEGNVIKTDPNLPSTSKSETATTLLTFPIPSSALLTLCTTPKVRKQIIQQKHRQLQVQAFFRSLSPRITPSSPTHPLPSASQLPLFKQVQLPDHFLFPMLLQFGHHDRTQDNTCSLHYDAYRKSITNRFDSFLNNINSKTHLHISITTADVSNFLHIFNSFQHTFMSTISISAALSQVFANCRITDEMIHKLKSDILRPSNQPNFIPSSHSHSALTIPSLPQWSLLSPRNTTHQSFSTARPAPLAPPQPSLRTPYSTPYLSLFEDTRKLCAPLLQDEMIQLLFARTFKLLLDESACKTAFLDYQDTSTYSPTMDLTPTASKFKENTTLASFLDHFSPYSKQFHPQLILSTAYSALYTTAIRQLPTLSYSATTNIFPINHIHMLLTHLFSQHILQLFAQQLNNVKKLILPAFKPNNRNKNAPVPACLLSVPVTPLQAIPHFPSSTMAPSSSSTSTTTSSTSSQLNAQSSNPPHKQIATANKPTTPPAAMIMTPTLLHAKSKLTPHPPIPGPISQAILLISPPPSRAHDVESTTHSEGIELLSNLPPPRPSVKSSSTPTPSFIPKKASGSSSLSTPKTLTKHQQELILKYDNQFVSSCRDFEHELLALYYPEIKLDGYRRSKERIKWLEPFFAYTKGFYHNFITLVDNLDTQRNSVWNTSVKLPHPNYNKSNPNVQPVVVLIANKEEYAYYHALRKYSLQNHPYLQFLLKTSDINMSSISLAANTYILTYIKPSLSSTELKIFLNDLKMISQVSFYAIACATGDRTAITAKSASH